MAVGASKGSFGAHCGSVGGEGGRAAPATQVTPEPLARQVGRWGNSDEGDLDA